MSDLLNPILGSIRSLSYLRSLISRRREPVPALDATRPAPLVPLTCPGGPRAMWVRTENGLRDHRVTFYGDRAAAMKFFGTTQVDVITRDELRYLIDE